MAIHKGTELNNVNETWRQNERGEGSDAPGAANASPAAGVTDDLQQTIREEAAEYDSADKDERLLSGERATVRDDDGND